MVEQENNQPESMEDILSSIRETVEEEAAAVSEQIEEASVEEPTNDVDVDALMAEATEPAIEEPIEDDALDLSAMLDEADEEPQVVAPAEEVVVSVNENVEEVIDIAAFNTTGEEMPASEEKAENARELYTGGEVDTEMLAESPVENVEEPLAEEAVEEPVEEPVVAEETPPVEEAIPEVQEEIKAEEVEEKIPAEPIKEEKTLEQQVEAVTEVATQVLTKAAQVTPSVNAVHLPTSPAADGLQVTFPVEVLASALRPLVKDWVAQNLPDVVERLVKEELSKLAEQ